MLSAFWSCAWAFCPGWSFQDRPHVSLGTISYTNKQTNKQTYCQVTLTSNGMCQKHSRTQGIGQGGLQGFDFCPWIIYKCNTSIVHFHLFSLINFFHIILPFNYFIHSTCHQINLKTSGVKTTPEHKALAKVLESRLAEGYQRIPKFIPLLAGTCWWTRMTFNKFKCNFLQLYLSLKRKVHTK